MYSDTGPPDLRIGSSITCSTKGSTRRSEWTKIGLGAKSVLWLIRVPAISALQVRLRFGQGSTPRMTSGSQLQRDTCSWDMIAQL